MQSLERQYALPADTLERFESMVKPDQRNAVIAVLLREWVDRGSQPGLHQSIVDGCREMTAIYQEIERDFHPLEEEAERSIDSGS